MILGFLSKKFRSI